MTSRTTRRIFFKEGRKKEGRKGRRKEGNKAGWKEGKMNFF